MGRRNSLAIAIAALITIIPTVGRAQMQTPAPQTPDIPADTEQLYDEVQVLRTIRTLELSADQLVELTQINARVISEGDDLEQLREDTWDQYGEDIETVLDAWVAAEDAPNREKTAADRAVNRVNEAESNYQSARRDAAEALYGILSEAQRDLVESPGAAEERSARTTRMGGIESVGDYVVAQLDAIRDLMPEEFEMLASEEARRIAETIVGPNAGTQSQRQMRSAVRDIIREVYGWTPQRYQQQRPTLAAQISSNLGVPTEDERPPISWSELTRAATSSRTPAAVAAVTPADDEEAEVE